MTSDDFIRVDDGASAQECIARNANAVRPVARDLHEGRRQHLFDLPGDRGNGSTAGIAIDGVGYKK